MLFSHFLFLLLWSKCSGLLPIFKIWIVFLLLICMGSIYVLGKILLFWIMIKSIHWFFFYGKCFLMFSLKWFACPRFAKIFSSVFFWRLYSFNYYIQYCYPPWINFCEYCEVGVILHFLFHMETQFFLYNLVQKSSFLPLNCLSNLLENQLTCICVGLFLDLLFFSI